MGSTRSIPVTGKCPKCRKDVTKDSPAGKVTWRGTCPHRGCDGYVVCRRVRPGQDAPAASPDEPQQQPEQPTKTPRKAVKVSGYQRRQPGRQPRTDPEVRPTDAGDGQPTGGEPDQQQPGQRAAGRRPEPETGRSGRGGNPYGDLFGWDA